MVEVLECGGLSEINQPALTDSSGYCTLSGVEGALAAFVWETFIVAVDTHCLLYSVFSTREDMLFSPFLLI